MMVDDSGISDDSPKTPDKMHEMTTPGGQTPPLRKYTLGQIIGYFKYQSTKLIGQINKDAEYRIWQRNYYEEIIRNEKQLNGTRKYIINNPIEYEQSTRDNNN